MYPYSAQPQFGRSSPYGQNRSFMDYWQRLQNRMLAEQILAEQEQAAQVPMEQFNPVSYQNDPEMPYLSGLSPMARYRDMGLRQMGRQLQYAKTPEQAMADQQLQQDAAAGVTRQPGGGVTTQGGGYVSAPQMGIRTLSSPYGKGASSMGSSVPRGTFSFQAADGTTVTAPMTAVRDPKFMKFMREEELGRAAGNTKQKGSGKSSSYEDIMAQIDSIRD
jgi:hypothetical protein